MLAPLTRSRRQRRPRTAGELPAIVDRYRIAFVPAAPPAPRIVVTPSGCLVVGVTLAGAAQPPLWGDTGLIGAANRLLHLRRVLQPGLRPPWRC